MKVMAPARIVDPLIQDAPSNDTFRDGFKMPNSQQRTIGVAIRRHWDIENNCYHLLDVSCREDRDQAKWLSVGFRVEVIAPIFLILRV